MKTKILLIILMLLSLSLFFAPRTLAMSQVTLENKTNFCLNLVVGGNMASTPAQPNLHSYMTVNPGSYWVEAWKCADQTIVKKEYMNIQDGASPVFTVTCHDVNCEENLNMPMLEQKIRQFYQTRGEWAGIFVMDEILRIKPRKIDDQTYELNVEYHYTPIPNNVQHRTDTGTDWRVFTLKIFAGNYSIMSMGGYHSAHF